MKKNTICMIFAILLVGTLISIKHMNDYMFYRVQTNDNFIAEYSFNTGNYTSFKIKFHEYYWNAEWIEKSTKYLDCKAKDNTLFSERNNEDLQIILNDQYFIFEDFFVDNYQVCSTFAKKVNIDSGEIYLISNASSSNYENIATSPENVEIISGIDDGRLLSIEFVLK